MERLAAKLAFAGISLGLVVIALALGARGVVGHQSFKAFYCAGVAVRERQDPYRVEPLRSCERRMLASPMPDGYVEPAPLPGYALAPFAALSVLPPKAAAMLFALLVAVAAIVSAGALAPLVRAPRAAVLLVLAPLTLLNIAYGEIPPFALAAICVSACFLSRGRWWAAGISVCVALIQPNVGLPAAAAVFFFAPRTRVPIAASAAVLALVSLSALGLTHNVEYFTKALPMMAQAELRASDQYSASHLLYAAGVSPSTSLLIGKIWFVLMTCAGVLVAGGIALRHRQLDVLPLLPPAFVLFVGIYLHDIQMLLALPAALVVASRVTGAAFRALAGLGLVLLTVVWTQRVARASMLVDAAGAAAGVFVLISGTAARRAAQALVGGLATVACVLLLQRFEVPLSGAMLTHDFHATAGTWAAVAWERYLVATPALTAPRFVLKIPTWIGLFAVMICAFRLCFFKPTPTLS